MVFLRNLLLPDPQLRQPGHNLYRLQADADDFGEQVEDILRVGGAVGVVDDAAAFVGFDAAVDYGCGWLRFGTMINGRSAAIRTRSGLVRVYDR